MRTCLSPPWARLLRLHGRLWRLRLLVRAPRWRPWTRKAAPALLPAAARVGIYCRPARGLAWCQAQRGRRRGGGAAACGGAVRRLRLWRQNCAADGLLHHAAPLHRRSCASKCLIADA